jgi:hypothetical protein
MYVKDCSTESFLNIGRGYNTYLDIRIHFQIRFTYRYCGTSFTNTHTVKEEGGSIGGARRKEARYKALDGGNLEVLGKPALIDIQVLNRRLKTLLKFSFSDKFGQKIFSHRNPLYCISVPFLPFSSSLSGRGGEARIRIETPPSLPRGMIFRWKNIILK